MLFASPRLLKFFEEELHYPKELIQEWQEGFLEAFMIYLETEINLYLTENGLTEEYEALEKVQKSDGPGNGNLIKAFIDMYIKYPVIKEKVDAHMQYFTKIFMANVHSRISEEQLAKMNSLIRNDIAALEKMREQLSEET